MLPMPKPAFNENIKDILKHVHIVDESDQRLLTAWLLYALQPSPPFPPLLLTGEHGSGKSTAARIIKYLIDPHEADLCCEPKSRRDLYITARGHWVYALDNLSRVDPWLSDCLCRISDGGASDNRKLYTDSDATYIKIARPVILTSIEDVANRFDLLDRVVTIELPRLGQDESVPDKRLRDELNAARPALLGALLQLLSWTLQNDPRRDRHAGTRNVDFASWGCAAMNALRLSESVFIEDIQANRAAAGAIAREAEVIFEPVVSFMHERRALWEGTATKLNDELLVRVSRNGRPPDGWPARPSFLSGKLKKIKAALREEGIEVTLGSDNRKGKGGNRIIRLVWTAPD
jgi:hypothetical protein